MSYNGWSNYETWVVKLWIDNDYNEYCYFKDMVMSSKDIYSLSQEIKDYFEENNPIENASVYSDLMNSALSSVDWFEIAESLYEDYEETEEEVI